MATNSITTSSSADTAGGILAVPQDSFAIALNTSQRSVVSVSDVGWVGNPATGRVVWVQYRHFSDNSNDTLVSQGGKGTGASLSFAEDTPISDVRANLGNSSSSIFGISTYSAAVAGSQSTVTPTPAGPRVVSTTDYGWVGNPTTGQTVWVQFRHFSDGSNDTLVSQGDHGTGSSLAYAQDTDISAIRGALGQSGSAIFSISTYSANALANAQPVASGPTVVSSTNVGWVGHPVTGQTIWVQYRHFSDGSNDVLASTEAYGRGPSIKLAQDTDISAIRENLGRTGTALYDISTYSAASVGFQPITSPGRPADVAATPGVNPIDVVKMLRPDKVGLGVETQVGEEFTLGNLKIPAGAKLKLKFDVPGAGFDNGINPETLPGLMASGSLSISIEVAGSNPIKLAYDFKKNQFSLSTEAKISEIKVLGDTVKVGYKSSEKIAVGDTGFTDESGLGISVGVYIGGKNSVFSNLATIFSTAATVVEAADIAAAPGTGGASLAALPLMETMKKLVTDAIKNGKFFVDASYPGTVSVGPNGVILKVGQNSVDLTAAAKELIKKIPVVNQLVGDASDGGSTRSPFIASLGGLGFMTDGTLISYTVAVDPATGGAWGDANQGTALTGPALVFQNTYNAAILAGKTDAEATKLAFNAYESAPEFATIYVTSFLASIDDGRVNNGLPPLTVEQRQRFEAGFNQNRANGGNEADSSAEALDAALKNLPLPAKDAGQPKGVVLTNPEIPKVEKEKISLSKLANDSAVALRIARESGNQLGVLLATIVNGIATTGIERLGSNDPFISETSAIAAGMQATGATFSQFVQLIGRGDLTAFGAVIGDVGLLYRDANLGTAGMSVGTGFRTIGDALKAVGQAKGNQGLVFAGTILGGTGDVIRGLNDGAPGTAQAAGAKLAGSLATLLGNSSNSNELRAIGIALSSAPDIAQMFNNNKVGDGQAALAEAASAALGALLGGQAGETVAKLGTLVGTGIRIASNTVPGGAGSLYVTAARQLLDLVGVKLDGATNFALGALSTVLASNPVGWAVFAVGALFSLFSMGSFTNTGLLQNNIDADGDGKFDDLALLKKDFYRGFFGGVRQTGSTILYDVNGVDVRLLQAAHVTFTPELTGAEPVMSNRGGYEEAPEYPFSVGALQGRIFDAAGNAVDARGYVGSGDDAQRAAGALIFVSSDGQRLSLRVNENFDSESGYGPYSAAWVAERPTGNTIMSIDAVYNAINPSTAPVGVSQKWTLSPADTAAWMQAFGGADVQIGPQDARVAAGSPLGSLLETLTARYQGTKNDPNLYVYMDMNGDGVADLVRIGLQTPGLKVAGDGKVTVTLLDQARNPIANPMTANNFAEAEEMATLAPSLYAWGLSNPTLWDRAVAGVSLKDWNAGTRPKPTLATFYEAARDAGVLPLMREARLVSGAVMGSLLSGQNVDFAAAFGRLDQINQALGSKFDAQAYMDKNPDVAAWAGNNALRAAEHYLDWGNNEGRAINAQGLVLPKWNPLALLTAQYVARPVTISLGIIQTGGGDDGYVSMPTLSLADPQATTGNPFEMLGLPAQAVPTYQSGLEDGFGGTASPVVVLSPVVGNAIQSMIGGSTATLAANDPRFGAIRELLAMQADPNRALSYIASYPDLIGAFGLNAEAAVEHFATYGWREGRTVSFDPAAYMAANTDVQSWAGGDPGRALQHYVEYGRFEGRALAPGRAGQPITITAPPPGIQVLGDRVVTGALGPNQALLSASKRFMTVMQADGNLVTYDMLRNMQPIWSTGTQGKAAGGSVAMQADGNLVVYQPGGGPKWWSGTSAASVNRPMTLVVMDDGNLVIFDSQGGEPLWGSSNGRFAYPEPNGIGNTYAEYQQILNAQAAAQQAAEVGTLVRGESEDGYPAPWFRIAADGSRQQVSVRYDDNGDVSGVYALSENNM